MFAEMPLDNCTIKKLATLPSLNRPSRPSAAPRTGRNEL